MCSGLRLVRGMLQVTVTSSRLQELGILPAWVHLVCPKAWDPVRLWPVDVGAAFSVEAQAIMKLNRLLTDSYSHDSAGYADCYVLFTTPV